MFAHYPRSGYYSGAALKVRSVALLHSLFFNAAELSGQFNVIAGRYIGHIFHFGTYAILHFTK